MILLSGLALNPPLRLIKVHDFRYHAAPIDETTELGYSVRGCMSLGIAKDTLPQPRMQYPGESIRWKSSRRRWLNGDGGWFWLTALVDEGTGRTLARFTPDNSLRENLQTLSIYISYWGRPRKVRTDRSTLFAGKTKNSASYEGGHIRRVLAELDIQWEPVESPRDLGRAAAFFEEVQSNLRKELESIGAKDIKDASAYLDNIFLPRWNSKIALAGPDCSSASHGPDVESILGTPHVRTVSRQGMVRFDNKLYRVSKFRESFRHLAGEEVRVETGPDGHVSARWNDSYIEMEQVSKDFRPPEAEPPTPAPSKKPRASNRAWMKGFFGKSIRPIWQIYK